MCYFCPDLRTKDDVTNVTTFIEGHREKIHRSVGGSMSVFERCMVCSRDLHLIFTLVLVRFNRSDLTQLYLKPQGLLGSRSIL